MPAELQITEEKPEYVHDEAGLDSKPVDVHHVVMTKEIVQSELADVLIRERPSE
jgi:hypothetical protein